MGKWFTIIGFILLVIILISCSGNPVQKGDDAFQQGDYHTALKFYTQALKEQPDNKDLQVKLTLADLMVGKTLAERRNIVTPVEGRYEKAMPLLSEFTSPDIRNTLSDICTFLGKKYAEMTPQNEIQKRQYLEKAFNYLNDALFYNPENSEAERFLEDFKKKNFQEMYDKGMSYFERARKEKKDYFYLSAEFYLQKAMEFDPQNNDVQKVLQQVRKLTLNMIDPDLPYAFAVTGNLKKDQFLGVSVVIVNNTSSPTEVSAHDFQLMDTEGNSIPGNINNLFEPQFPEGTLAAAAEKEGVVVFEVGNKKWEDFEKIVYQNPDGKMTVKYIPRPGR